MKRFSKILFAFFLFICLFATAAELPSPLSGYRMEYWTADDALPQNQVAAIKQTSDGYLWIGTWFGLVRYDGANFRIFQSANTPGMPSETVNALEEHPVGTLWVATQSGLAVRHGQHFESIQPPPGEKNGTAAWDIVPGRGDSVWVHIAKGVSQYSNGAFTKFWNFQVPNQTAIQMLANAGGSVDVLARDLWVTISADGNHLQTNLVREASEPEWFSFLRLRRSGRMLIGTRKGVYTPGPAGKLEPLWQEKLGDELIDKIFEDAEGRIWLNSRGKGFYFCEADVVHAVELGDLFEPGALMCAEQDGTGALWFGTRSGLIHFTKRPVKSWTVRNGLAYDRVWSVCQMEDGQMAVGSEQGLSFIKAGVARPGDSAASGMPTADRLVWPRAGGGLWTIRNKGGLFRYQDGKFDFVYPGTNLLTCIYGDGQGFLYVGTESNLLMFAESTPIPWKAPLKTFPFRKSYAVNRQSDGTLWSGSDSSGLARIQGSNITVYTPSNGLPSTNVWDLLPDQHGGLWIATMGGLSYFANERFITLTTEQGLRENMINSMVTDDSGDLWLGGQHGIYRIARDELLGVASGRLGKVHPFALSTADGMQTSETNGGRQPTRWKSNDGRVWFPTMRGVVAIDPRDVPKNELPPSVAIEEVKAAEGTVYGDFFGRSRVASKDLKKQAATAARMSEPIRLKPGSGRVIEFTYTAMCFLDPRRVHFSYRLVGADKDWRAETNERTVRYINLQPGNYRFEVKAGNEHNVWNEIPASFAFYLAPHFYETTTFYVGCILFTAAVVFGAFGYRLRWQRRLARVEQQRALDNERTRIARDLHDDLGSALTGLAIELDLAGNEATKGKMAPEKLRESASNTRSLADRMRQLVWTVNPSCDNVSSLASFLEQQVEHFLRSDRVRMDLDFPEEIPDLPLGSAARYQIALVVREALTNVVRHSGATQMTLRLRFPKAENGNGSLHSASRANQFVRVEVQDNGRGLSNQNRLGNGLLNMRARVEKIGGQLEFQSPQPGGTLVVLIVPVTSKAK